MLEYGTWTGVTLISFAIMLFFLGAHYENSTSTQIINALIQFSGITIACLAFKKANSNTITWGETRKIGTGISLIIAILSIVYTLLLTNFLEPDFMNKVLELSYYDTMEKNPEFLANMSLNEFIDVSMPWTYLTYPFILFFSVLFGFVYSVILGLFIKSKNVS
jgi:hypothetical protein